MPDLVPLRRALLSVADKTGLVDFARGLARHHIQILSTGGTSRALRDAGLSVTDIGEVTSFPEIMDGRVKTLHPKIHGGLLADRDNSAHIEALKAHAIDPIDLVAVNLYPFEAAEASGADDAVIVENIDIGGPAMIRSAAKNHKFVTVVVEPEDYSLVLEEIAAQGGATSLATRRRLAAKTYTRTAAYDAAISRWLIKDEAVVPTYQSFGGRLAQCLRYGENPHQKAAFYHNGENRPGVATTRQLQGKALSYNNINDADTAFECVAEFDPAATAAVAIVKHATPCGVARDATLCDAYKKALAGDPVSAFGGIVALNRPLDVATARELVKIFTEVIMAPGAHEDALAIMAGKKNLRLLVTDGLPDPATSGSMIRSVSGGFLVQERDCRLIADQTLKVVTKRPPDATEMADLRFAFTVAKHVKSNAIVYVRDGATLGIGSGQTSRIDSCSLATRKAARGERPETPATPGLVAASDAFFPFADGVLAIAEAGATAAIQPGGSVRDGEVIAAADEAGMAMVFTGIRHFRH
ncbi:MAG: bifunctional phosphoribosylaminoimidazolecarboxamide formyltransferase/IMP cyclohydrolase [Hyphomicrobiales bacterium]